MEYLYSCLMFGEGRRDKKFLYTLVDLEKFKYHTKKWAIQIDSGRGCSPEVIVKDCIAIPHFQGFDLVLCFIDLDKLKQENPRKWEEKQKELELKYKDIVIIWQIEHAEDEYRRALGEQCSNKHKINKIAQQNIEKFINTDFWKRILKPINDKENELDNQ